MIRKLLFFIIFFALIAAALPAVDGFLFKRYFYQRIAEMNNNLGKSAKIQIEITSYQMGWLHSQANIVLILKNETAKKYSFSLAPDKYEMTMTVDHGPLVKTDRGIKLAYANTRMEMMMPYFKDSSIIINNLYSLFSHTITSHYHISPLNVPKFMNWDGLNGQTNYSTNGAQRIVNTTNIGKLNSVDTDAAKFDIQPIQIYYEMTGNLAANTMSSQLRTITDGFSYSSSSTQTAMSKLLYSSTDELKNDLYQHHSTLNIHTLTLPLSQSIEFNNILIENNMSGFKFTNQDHSSNYSMSALLSKHLTPSAKISMSTAFDTSHGHTDIRVSAADFAYKAKEKPSSIPDQYTLSIQGQMPRELAQLLLANYFSLKTAISGFTSMAASKLESMNNGELASSATSPDASNILVQLVQQGFLVEKDNLLTVNYSQKNGSATLNDAAVTNMDERYAALTKIFSGEDEPATQAQTDPNGRKCLYSVTNIHGEMVCGKYAEPEQTPAPATETPAPTPAPSATPAVPAQPQAAAPQPSAPAATYGCYWMQTEGGKSWWVLIKELDTKKSCFVMDSCNGGQGASHGQCFKWATSPDGAPQAW